MKRHNQDSYFETAEFYDHVTAYRERADVQFFVDYAAEAEGEVLEVGCGTGRVLIPTAQAGHAITGLDASEAMLGICRRKLAKEDAQVREKARLETGDMRAFELNRTFALATIPFRPFQHLIEVEEQLACLGCIHRHLETGGRLILDLFNPSLHHLVDKAKEEKHVDEPGIELPDGRRLERFARLPKRDYAKQVVHAELIYCLTYPDGRKEEYVHAFQMRYLFRYEAEHLLVRAGFELEQVYAGYDRAPFGSTYPGELILVARKRA